ncbi:MAG: hypothetical protein CMA63_07460 [Euryarchaeota archaeon]|nr:hypothetical protein [Euryarchaeota archaeon]
MSVDLTTPQERILHHLGQFSSDLETAWDVPRDLSLPGLSDALGVVRSALNIPLSLLEETGMVTKRMAHVIGTGTRRRNVFHLTEQGRTAVQSIGKQSLKPRNKKSSTMHGEVPTLGVVHGREGVLNELESSLFDAHSIVLSGLPGIGKSTVGSALFQALAHSGKTVRWFTADEFSDLNAMGIGMEFEAPLPSNIQAFCEYVANRYRGEILFLDDVHAVSLRHSESFSQFIHQMELLEGPQMVLIGREPLAFSDQIARIPLSSLEHAAAVELLGDEHSENERLHIVERLGGHPLAILLHHSESELPESSQDIQMYVENVVMSSLDDATKSSLDHFVVLPMPISASKVADSDAVSVLDEHAFLRWTDQSDRMEVQHFIRNVRRAMLDEHEKQRLHEAAIAHWTTIATSPEDHLHLLYHRISAQSTGLEHHCQHAVEVFGSPHSGALAVLLEHAIEVEPSSSHLHFLASKVALERCETSHVHRYMSVIEDVEQRSEIEIGLAHLEGRVHDAEASIEAALQNGTQAEKNRVALSAASRRLDDRLPHTNPAKLLHDVNQYLSHVSLPDQIQQREVTLVALTMVQHSAALVEGDTNKAEHLRTSLSTISGFDDALMLGLQAKANLVLAKEVPSQLEAAIQLTNKALAKQTHSVHRTALQLFMVETLIAFDPDRARVVFDGIELPNDVTSIVIHHRISARWWYCKSKLYPSTALASLKEAITLHRAAGCSRAARLLEAEMHAML